MICLKDPTNRRHHTSYPSDSTESVATLQLGERRIIQLPDEPPAHAQARKNLRQELGLGPKPLKEKEPPIPPSGAKPRLSVAVRPNIPEARRHITPGHRRTKSRIRVFVAAPNQTTVRAICSALSCDDIIVIGTANSPSELETALHIRPDIDILVTDVVIAGQQTHSIYAPTVAAHPELNVLCYTFRSEPGHVMASIHSGALGYVLRGAGEDLANCVRLLKGGGSPMSPAVTRHVLRALQLKKQDENQRTLADIPELSRRELEILELLAKGISFSDIATILIISPHTVTAHIKKIYRKLQVHSRGEAVYEARALNLLSDV